MNLAFLVALEIVVYSLIQMNNASQLIRTHERCHWWIWVGYIRVQYRESILRDWEQENQTASLLTGATSAFIKWATFSAFRIRSQSSQNGIGMDQFPRYLRSRIGLIFTDQLNISLETGVDLKIQDLLQKFWLLLQQFIKSLLKNDFKQPPNLFPLLGRK